ncbi:MAG: FAD-dependent oxidoreductase, partial [Rhodospirillaceae bacterium]|nr:FAD-dependent oxidoreductase [Rhodospirillaceae bacterium]
GDARGLFCGMGVCQECRVQVDGRSGVRACMATVKDAMRVARMPERAVPGDRPEEGAAENQPESPDLLVIGGGPAGLTAAAVAAESGADVAVIDERPALGGQFFKQPASAAVLPPSLAGDRQFERGRQLIERARRSGARILNGAEVWGAFAPNEVGVLKGSSSWIVRPKRTVVATGAYERGLPVPGWTLPGVMTTGAAQTLLRSYGVLAGQRLLVAGNGPLNLQVALELKRAGAKVAAVAESARPPGRASPVDAVRLFRSAPRLALDGVRYLAGLRSAGVPVLYRRVLKAVHTTDGGLAATLVRVGEEERPADRTIEVDAVCVGYGFQPNNEVLRCLGCRHDHDERRGHLVTVRNEHCETTVPGIYAIGDCCGLGGAPAALDEGVIAACAAVRSLGFDLTPGHARAREQAVRTLRRHRIFQAALWRVFDAPRYQTELAAPDTLICRCERVRLSDLDAAVEDGNATIGMLKRRTRLGMGPCQGRYCAPVAAAMLERLTGTRVDEFSLFAPRVPIKPVRVGDIAGV